jgi:hypothetical protein
VRLYKPIDTKPAKAIIRIASLDLEAASQGAWGNNLRARIDAAVSADVAARLGLTAADLFNVTVRDMATGTTERIVNLSVKESARRADRVLAAESDLVRVSKPAALPGTAVPSPHPAPAAGKSIWEDDAASSKVATADLALDSAPLEATAYLGDAAAKTGMNALQKTDLFNLLCIPPDTRNGDTPITVWQGALAFCVARRAMVIIDAPAAWSSAGFITANNTQARQSLIVRGRCTTLRSTSSVSSNPTPTASCLTLSSLGCVAGVMARTDGQRGVWRPPVSTRY